MRMDAGNPDSPMEPAGLLKKLQSRDRQGLEALAGQFGQALVRVAAVRLGDPEAAWDVAQETLLVAWTSADRLRDPERLRSWLFGILLNRCRRHQRSLARRMRRIWRAWRQRPSPDPERIRRIDAVRDALGQLDVHHRTVIALRFEQSCSVAETAETLGIPEGTVKSRTHAAIGRLRQILELEDQ